MSSLEVEGWHEEHLADSTDLLPENKNRLSLKSFLKKLGIQLNVKVWIKYVHFS